MGVAGPASGRPRPQTRGTALGTQPGSQCDSVDILLSYMVADSYAPDSEKARRYVRWAWESASS